MSEFISNSGLYDDVGMIDSVIVMLDGLEVKGVQNMKIIFDSIARLDAVKKSLINRKEEKPNAET